MFRFHSVRAAIKISSNTHRCVSIPRDATSAVRGNLASFIETTKKPHELSLSKIVATIGPASENLPMLQHVVDAGMRIMRINFSHATYEEADLRVNNLRKCHGIGGTTNNFDSTVPLNLRAIMLDTQGPEIRTGSFGNNIKEIDVSKGSYLTVCSDPAVQFNQSKERLWISYESLYTHAKIGDSILIDDGSVQLEVKKVHSSELECEVKNNGTIGNKKGVNLPGFIVDLPAMSDKDKEDIYWGIKNDIDYIAASFTRKASDIIEIKEYVASLMKELQPLGHPHPMIISKIESIEALENFDSILHAADGIMVARGDLGVEIPMETLANVQKEIVRRCNIAGKPVIVATQMLESMQKNPRPTRAECTDVANAVWDGADCVMLSGESAKGKYPVDSIATMRRIVIEAEKFVNITSYTGNNSKVSKQGLGHAVVESAKNAEADFIIAISPDGQMAMNISAFRPNVPIVAFVGNAKIARQLQMFRGVHPALASIQLLSEPNFMFRSALKQAVSLGFGEVGHKVIVVTNESEDVVTTRTMTIE